jgi:hypothetical protein
MSSFLDYLNGDEDERTTEGVESGNVVERLFNEVVSIRELLEEIADALADQAEERKSAAAGQKNEQPGGGEAQRISVTNVGSATASSGPDANNLRESIDSIKVEGAKESLLDHVAGILD